MPELRKIFIQLLNEHVLAEHDHTVAFLNLGHTVYVHTFAATYQSADSNSGGKAEVFHRFLGDPGSGLYFKFCYIGVGHGQAIHVGNVRIQHHLVNMTGGNRLFVDDGADIQSFGHGDIVQIVY